MEARQITIVSSRSQQKTVITSSAETLGELKADLSANGINYDGLAFFEGISKTELKDDAAILPKDLPWKGQKTNNLVFMLTESQKRIRNGAAIVSRADAYAYIKANGLGADVEKKFGQNFTRCKTPDLVTFCIEHSTPKTAPKTAVSKKVTTKKVASKVAKPATKTAPAVTAPTATPSNIISHEQLVALLVDKAVITYEEAVTGKISQSGNVEFSDSEINAMFKNVR